MGIRYEYYYFISINRLFHNDVNTNILIKKLFRYFQIAIWDNVASSAISIRSFEITEEDRVSSTTTTTTTEVPTETTTPSLTSTTSQDTTLQEQPSSLGSSTSLGVTSDDPTTTPLLETSEPSAWLLKPI